MLSTIVSGCGASPTSPSSTTPPYTIGPPRPVPFTPRLTITDDMPGGQHILVPPRPVAFTATTEGGSPPYEYAWRINNVLIRDWKLNQVLVWDGLTLEGRPTVSGRDTLVVSRRTPGDTQLISAAIVNFQLQYR